MITLFKKSKEGSHDCGQAGAEHQRIFSVFEGRHFLSHGSLVWGVEIARVLRFSCAFIVVCGGREDGVNRSFVQRISG